MKIPPTAVTIAAARKASQIEMWIPRVSGPIPIAPKCQFTCWNCPDASQAAVYAPSA